MENVIEISHLKKSFGDVRAVDDISFSVRKGQLFAFLGLNGAGKSTTINILVGVVARDAGECTVNGRSIDDAAAILPHIGIVFQSSVLDKKLTVHDNLRYRAALYGLDRHKFETNLAFLTEALDMRDILRKSPEKLSGGQRRKADIARALIHKPDILILDEPTTGLDPKTRKIVWELVGALRRSERLTVLLTTHYMEEAAEADYVVIMDAGKIAARGTPIDLKNEFADDYLNIYAYADELLPIVRRSALPYTTDRGYLRIGFKSTAAAKDFLVEHARLIDDMEILKGSMDDVFLAATGKELRETV